MILGLISQNHIFYCYFVIVSQKISGAVLSCSQFALVYIMIDIVADTRHEITKICISSLKVSGFSDEAREKRGISPCKVYINTEQ